VDEMIDGCKYNNNFDEEMITLTLWMAHRIFELAPVKTTALTWRLRPLGHEVICCCECGAG
jgi:hypothetical protein